MAERVIIPAAPRAVLGKKVKQLRQQGRLPGNVYGKGVESRAIDVDTRDFLRTLKSHGIRGMFELKIDGEPAARYVIVRGFTRFGGTGEPLHVDFFQVDPNKAIQANVPIRLVGEAPAVRDLAGTLLQSLEYISAHCLPLDIPEAVDADVSRIVNFDANITVGDIVPPAGVQILTDPSLVVAVVNPPRIRLDVGTTEGAEGEGQPAEDEPEAGE